MATISFLMDADEEHLLSSFALAHPLREEGHRIIYISVPRNAAIIVDEGFEFYPFFIDIYPKELRKYYTQKQVGGSGRTSLRDLGADIFIISSFLYIEALLVHYYLRIKPLLFCSSLHRQEDKPGATCTGQLMQTDCKQVFELIDFVEQLGYRFNSLAGFTSPLNSFPLLLACPRELLLPDARPFRSGSVNYIGPCIKKQRGAAPLFLPKAAGKKIVYASLNLPEGFCAGKDNPLYSIMLELMQQPSMQDFHLVLNAGKCISEQYEESPSVTVVSRNSGMDVTSQASLVITCGNLGTIKECIYYGVPMIAMSLNGEQPENGELITHHGLGRVLLLPELSAAAIAANIAAIVNDPAYAKRLEQMKHVFRYRESSRPANRVIAAELRERQKSLFRQERDNR